MIYSYPPNTANDIEKLTYTLFIYYICVYLNMV